MKSLTWLRMMRDTRAVRNRTIAEQQTLSNWGTAIRIQRESRQMSQEALGDRLDPPVDKGSVSRWEQGKAEPMLFRKIQLASALGLAPSILFPLPTTIPAAA